MKNIGTILIYVILISVIPLSTGYYIFFYSDNSNVNNNIEANSKILNDQFNEYKDKSIIIKVRSMLVNKKFDALNKYLENLDNTYTHDISIEEKLHASYVAFGITDISYEPFFNDWIKSYPNSYIPYLAKGVFYYHRGWEARGGKYISETKLEQIMKMNDYFNNAQENLSKSLSLNKNAIFAYRTLMGLASTTGQDDEVENLFKKALEINKYSLIIRQQYLKNLTPRWGGSYQAMKDYLDNTTLDLNANPKLKYLYGVIYADQGDLAELSDSYNKANELFQKALELTGDYDYLYFRLGKNSIRRENYKDGIYKISKAIELENEDSDYYYWRAFGYIKLEKYQKAMDDLLYAYALNPFDEDIKRKQKYLASVLNYKAFKLRQNYETEKAYNLYAMALKLDLNNDSIYDGIARVYIQKQELDLAITNVKRAIEINPNDINHYLLIDYLFAKYKDWDKIISYWDKFIELHPNNARAYVERGGAYYHKGDMKKAVQNAKISADLGNLEGKEAYEKFKHLVR